MRNNMTMAGARTATIALLIVLATEQKSQAATLDEARSAAIVWLERNQETAPGTLTPAGYWGVGLLRPTVTAEATLALIHAGRGDGFAARRSLAWLKGSEFVAVDHRARRLRARLAAGESVASDGAALLAEITVHAGTTSFKGFGATDGLGPTSYDTALGFGAIEASGASIHRPFYRDALTDRRRADNGWSADDTPAGGASDKTVSAEIVRSAAEDAGFATSLAPSVDFLRSTPGEMLNLVSDLELAARLAAIHRAGSTDTDLETELLSRVSIPGAWGNDAFVNAIGLLAVVTKPGAGPFGGGPTDDDDLDGVANEDDPFPQDGNLTGDLDGDGIGDEIDADRDGDGVLDIDEPLFADDPTEQGDNDGDSIGNTLDDDDDNDGVSDEKELEDGTNPFLADTDGDLVDDDEDACPLVAFVADDDLDGVCADTDCDDGDPFEALDLDGDAICDGPDLDDDGDGFSDLDELAYGSDPRNAASTPPDLASTDPSGDWDADGIPNQAELIVNWSPFRKDTDNDGALDLTESTQTGFFSVTNPTLAPPPGIATVSSFSPAPAATQADGSLRSTNSGAQSTPVAALGDGGERPAGGFWVMHPGILPQVGLAADHDGDGVDGFVEAHQGTSLRLIDTDGDRFADGTDGHVAISEYPNGWDLDDDGFVDGESDLGTDPADPEDRAGRPGDVAPFGTPDGRLDARDAVVGAQIALDPGITATLPNAHQTQIANEAANANEDSQIDAADAVFIQQQVIAE